MKFFDSIKKLFGEGYIYADVVCIDGSTARVRAPFIGDPTTFRKDEFTEKLSNEMHFKHGKRIESVNNIRFVNN